MTVRRTLPQRQRSLIGAWCFADHYGPDDVAATGGMDVPPHPHTGLQTVSWLFTGEIEHRDSLGIARDGPARRAQPDDRRPRHRPLRGLHARDDRPARRPAVGRPAGRRTATPPRTSSTTRRRPSASTAPPSRVFLGTLAGQTSPVETFTPLLGAEVVLDAGCRRSSSASTPAYEHGVLADSGGLTVDGDRRSPRSALAYLPTGPSHARARPTRRRAGARAPARRPAVRARRSSCGGTSSAAATRRSSTAREEWMAHSERFGEVEGYAGEVQHLPAPAIPAVRIRPRTATLLAHLGTRETFCREPAGLAAAIGIVLTLVACLRAVTCAPTAARPGALRRLVGPGLRRARSSPAAHWWVAATPPSTCGPASRCGSDRSWAARPSTRTTAWSSSRPGASTRWRSTPRRGGPGARQPATASSPSPPPEAAPSSPTAPTITSDGCRLVGIDEGREAGLGGGRAPSHPRDRPGTPCPRSTPRRSTAAACWSPTR